jgi:hypothetical protein
MSGFFCDLARCPLFTIGGKADKISTFTANLILHASLCFGISTTHRV